MFYVAAGGYGLSVIVHLASWLGFDPLAGHPARISFLGAFSMASALFMLLSVFVALGRSVDQGLDLWRVYGPFTRYRGWVTQTPRWLSWIAMGSFVYVILNFLLALFLMVEKGIEPNILRIFSGGCLLFYGAAMANFNPFSPKMRRRDPARHKKRPAE